MIEKQAKANRSVQIGLIGFGIRLRSVIGRVLALAGGRLHIAAVYDPDQSALERAGNLYGAEVSLYTSEEEFFAHSGLDWVFIASPNHLHCHHVTRALNAGLDVFCEKPLATNLEDCLVVKDLLEETGRVFAFGLVLRYSPFYQEIKRIIERGDIGSIVSFEFNETLDFDHGGRRIFSTWRRDFDLAGSHLLEKCCHDLDIANWLIGSLPTHVASFGGLDFFRPMNAGQIERVGPAPDGRTAYRPFPDEPNTRHPFSEGASIVDNQVAILQYANGVRATFHTNCNTALRERRFYICGTEGTLHGDAYSGQIEWRRIGYETETYKVQANEGGGQGHAGGDEVMAANLIEAMFNGGPLLTDVDDGIRACVVAFAIDQAMQEKVVVDLSEGWSKCGIDPYQQGKEGLLQEIFSESGISVSSGV